LKDKTKLYIIPPVQGEKGDAGDLNSKDEVENYFIDAMTPATYQLQSNINR